MNADWEDSSEPFCEIRGFSAVRCPLRELRVLCGGKRGRMAAKHPSHVKFRRVRYADHLSALTSRPEWSAERTLWRLCRVPERLRALRGLVEPRRARRNQGQLRELRVLCGEKNAGGAGSRELKFAARCEENRGFSIKNGVIAPFANSCDQRARY